MSPLQIEKYVLSYRPTKSDEVSFQMEASDKEKSEALKHPHRLLYIVKCATEFLYVGEAKSNLNTRLQRGFTSYRYFKRTGTARGGYQGYKWIKLVDPSLNTPKKLNVWAVLLPESYDKNRDYVEAIEGEIVWEIRKRTNQWPTQQNEIHFNNKLSEASIIANKILEELT